MRTFVSEGTGRTIVIHLDRGDLVIESIEKKLAELGIKNAALVTTVGTLSTASYHFITSNAAYPVDKFVKEDGAYEVLTMQGLILNGKAHFHYVLSSPDKGVITGHVEEGNVIQNLMEMCIIELPGQDLERRKNKFGINYIARVDDLEE